MALAAGIFYNPRSPRNTETVMTQDSDHRRFCYLNLIERGRLPMDGDSSCGPWEVRRLTRSQLRKKVSAANYGIH